MSQIISETASLTGHKVCIKLNTVSGGVYTLVQMCVQGVFVLTLVGLQRFNAITIHTHSADT